MSLPTYQAGQASSYAQAHGWRTKSAGDNFAVETCPLCSRSGYKFYVNDVTGLWVDHHASCGQKGNWFQLLRQLDDAPETTRAYSPLTPTPTPKKTYPLSSMLPYEVALADDAEALAYLASRGLTQETVQAWHFGLKDEAGKRWLLMPYVQGDQVVDVKYRTLPPAEKGFKRMGGGDSILYGEQTLREVADGQHDVLYLVEGELDAVTLWQHGYRPVVSTTTGAGSFKPRWYDLIISHNPKTIYVVYDSDVAGQQGAAALLKRFDDLVVKNVVLPTKDANEFFQTHTKAEFDALLTDTQEVELPNVVSMAEALNRLEMELFMAESGFSGIESQFPEINELIGGGYWKGFLVTLSGAAGMGKTSFVLQELFWAATQRHPTYLLCLEMPIEMMTRKLIEHRFHKNKLTLNVDDIQGYRGDLEPVPIYLGSQVKDVEDLEKTIRAAHRRYGIEMLAFDNINYFVRSREHQTQEIGVVSKLLKQLAVELNICIVCIAQPTKFDANERVMTQNDIKDSSSIQQDADVIMLLSRRRHASTVKTIGQTSGIIGNYYPETLVRVDKARYAPGGETILYFHGDVSTYRSLTADEKLQLTDKKD